MKMADDNRAQSPAGIWRDKQNQRTAESNSVSQVSCQRQETEHIHLNPSVLSLCCKAEQPPRNDTGLQDDTAEATGNKGHLHSIHSRKSPLGACLEQWNVLVLLLCVEEW